MIVCNPDALPWHVRINDGVVQVNDQGGLDSFGLEWGSSPNFTRGPRAVRSVTEQWGADAVTNPRIVKKLQDVYREAIGIPPEPDPDFFAAAQRLQDKRAQGRRSSEAEELPPGKLVDEKEKKSNAADSETNSLSDGLRDVAITWPDFEVPSGWFHVGRKCDVPHNACYVGHHCDCYVWITKRGEADFKRFSLVILATTNSQTHSIVNSQLAYTR